MISNIPFSSAEQRHPEIEEYIFHTKITQYGRDYGKKLDDVLF